MDISDLNFAASGGVTAESIHARPPVCAPKSVPALDPYGQWECVASGSPTGLGGGSTLLLLALAGGAWWYFTRYHHGGRHHTPAVPVLAAGAPGEGSAL